MRDLTKRTWKDNPYDEPGSPTMAHLGTQQLWESVFYARERLEKMKKQGYPRIVGNPFENRGVLPFPIR